MHRNKDKRKAGRTALCNCKIESLENRMLLTTVYHPTPSPLLQADYSDPKTAPVLVSDLQPGDSVTLSLQSNDRDSIDGDGSGTFSFDGKNYSVKGGGAKATFTTTYSGTDPYIRPIAVDDGDDSVTVTVTTKAQADLSLTGIQRDLGNGDVDVTYATGARNWSLDNQSGASQQLTVALWYATGTTPDTVIGTVPLKDVQAYVSTNANVTGAFQVHFNSHELPQPPSDKAAYILAELVDAPISNRLLVDSNLSNNVFAVPTSEILPDYSVVSFGESADGTYQLKYNVSGGTPESSNPPVVQVAWGEPTTDPSGFTKVSNSPLLLAKAIQMDTTETQQGPHEMDFDIDPAALKSPPAGAVGVIAILNYTKSVTEVTNDNDVAMHFLPIVAKLRITSGNLVSPVNEDWIVTGEALDFAGNPVADAPVTLDDAILTKSRPLGKTDAEGQFSIAYQADETESLDPGLYINALHSGNANLYYKCALTPDTLINVDVTHVRFSFGTYTDQSQIDQQTLIFAHRAPGMKPAALTASNILTWAQKLDADLRTVVLRSVEDTVEDFASDKLLINTPYQMWVNPKGALSMDFALAGAADLPIAFGVNFLQNLIKKDSAMSAADKDKFLVATKTAKVATDVIGFAKNLKHAEPSLEFSSGVVGALKDAREASAQYLKVQHDAAGNESTGIDFIDTKGNVFAIAIALEAPIHSGGPVHDKRSLSNPTPLRIAAVGQTSVTISFDAPSDPNLLTDVEFSKDQVDWREINAVAGSSFTVNGILPGVTVFLRVRATDGTVYGPYSNVVRATAGVPVAPPAPGDLVVKAINSASATLTWTDHAAGTAGYKVTWSDNNLNFSHEIDVAAGASTTVTIPLQAGKHYWFNVVATNSIGNSPVIQVQATTPSNAPATPTGLRIRAGSLAPNEVIIDWTDASGGGASFGFQWSDNNIDWSHERTLAAGVTSSGIVPLQPDRHYWFRVRSENAHGVSPWATLQADTPSGLPAAPTSLLIQPGSLTPTSVVLTWTDNTGGAAGYQFQWSDNNVDYSHEKDLSAGTATTVTIPLQPGRHYWFQVRAVSSFGSSAWAKVQADSPSGLPAVPAGLAIRPGSLSATSVILDWTDTSSGSATFRFQWSDNNTDWSHERTFAAGTTSSGSVPLQPGRHYWFRVRAENAFGTSGWITVQADSPSGLPADPTNLTIQPGSLTATSITLTWIDTNGGAAGYQFQWSDNNVDYSHEKDLNPGGPTTVTIPLQPNRHYWFQVRATNSFGVSNWAMIQADSPDARPPAPTNFAIQPGSLNPTSVVLTWTDNSGGAAGYQVQWSDNNVDYSHEKDLNPGDPTSVTIPLQPGRHYWFQVRATDSFGTSAWATLQADSPGVNPADPSNLLVQPGSLTTNSAILNWTDTSGGAASFRFQWSDNNTDWSHERIFGAGTTSSGVVPLQSSRHYWFRVRAENTFGVSNWITVQADTPSAAPSNLHVRSGSLTSTAVILDWTDTSNGFATFRFQWSDNNVDWSHEKTFSAGITSSGTIPLRAGRHYWFRVRAESAGGVSDWVTIQADAPA